MLLSVKEYAARIGRSPVSVRQKILRGTLPAQKIGRDWLIDEDMPYEDGRVTSGKYVNWRKRGKSDGKAAHPDPRPGADRP